ncbi:MAG: anti-sigma factor [Sphingobacteriaceae bacterium]|nr:MAG: anti-sigma factor [Sphingobacteriaceae bacterium]
MEDIKQYIESGILELYVLGNLAPQEKREVEEYAANYPAIKQELNDISRTMELFADHNAIEPRESLRETIVNQLISGVSTQNKISSKSTSFNDDNKVFSLKAANQTPFYKYAFAASVALLLVSLIALLNTYNHLKESRQQLLSLQVQNEKFANQVNFQQNQLNQLQQNTDQPAIQNPVLKDSIVVKEKGNQGELIALENALKRSKERISALETENASRDKAESIFYDPDSRFIKLKTTGGNKSGSALLIAWNPEKNKLYINKKGSGLAPNDKDHQYQLWAIRKLKPVSLGVFNIGEKDSIIQSMTSIDKAAAFAVTLEPRGGSEKPTLKQMVAMSISHK